MEEREERGGAVKVGMIWGGIGGVVGLLVSLLGSLDGILVAGSIGFSCGRRAAIAGNRAGELSGLVGGACAAPVYVLGSTLVAPLAALQFVFSWIATALSDLLCLHTSAYQPW